MCVRMRREENAGWGGCRLILGRAVVRMRGEVSADSGRRFEEG